MLESSEDNCIVAKITEALMKYCKKKLSKNILVKGVKAKVNREIKWNSKKIKSKPELGPEFRLYFYFYICL